jgi:hypothetical protein
MASGRGHTLGYAETPVEDDEGPLQNRCESLLRSASPRETIPMISLQPLSAETRDDQAFGICLSVGVFFHSPQYLPLFCTGP